MQLPFEEIADRYDVLNDVISLGLHRRWKTRMVKRLVEAQRSKKRAAAMPALGAETALDVGTGTGDVARLLSNALPARSTRVLGLDPSPNMLAQARRRHGASAALSWIEGGAEQLPLPDDSVTWISAAFSMRNVSDRAAALSEWRRVLHPQGLGAIVEIHRLSSAGSYPLSGTLAPLVELYWTRVMPRIGQLFGFHQAYRYLRDSSLAFIAPDQLEREAGQAGLRRVHDESLFGGGMVTLSMWEVA